MQHPGARGPARTDLAGPFVLCPVPSRWRSATGGHAPVLDDGEVLAHLFACSGSIPGPCMGPLCADLNWEVPFYTLKSSSFPFVDCSKGPIAKILFPQLKRSRPTVLLVSREIPRPVVSRVKAWESTDRAAPIMLVSYGNQEATNAG